MTWGVGGMWGERGADRDREGPRLRRGVLKAGLLPKKPAIHFPPPVAPGQSRRSLLRKKVQVTGVLCYLPAVDI